ncbi:MAG: hypothetical protein HKN98_06465 [Silicimonas sp.]|nr:hypothetical protein [Silicimonas sp.]
MTDRVISRPPAPNAVNVLLAGVAGGLAAFVALTVIAMSRNSGAFEYALDDVYIHLAVAGEIARGGYGVNPGELASAASSPLYPFLLTPFAGTSLQRWLPLIWNVIALSVASALFALVMVRAGLGRVGAVLATAAPFALATYVTAFTGMENMAHVAASLATVLGLWHFVQTDRIGGFLIAGVVFATALRLEGLALGMAAGGVVALSGRTGAGLGLMALAVLPAVLFVLFLMWLGLDPLPNSITAKLQDTGPVGVIGKFQLNIATYGGRYLLVLAVVVLLVSIALYSRDRRVGLFGLAVAAVGLAHLAFGSIGWMDRYETYANVSLVAALALLLGSTTSLLQVLAVSLALAGGVVTYAPYALSVYAWNPAAIAAQHAQLARLASDHINAPVAVNDIGYVAWADPDYVLDLWGLASSEALSVRLAEPDDGWAGPLVSKRGIPLAMIYDNWLGDAVPKDWRRLGSLHLEIPNAFLGGREVAFYATGTTVVGDLKKAITEWQPGLPSRARFEWAEQTE